MESILDFDFELFQLINQDFSNRLFDFYLPIFRNKYTWIPVYVFIVSFLIFRFQSKSWKIIVFTFLTVGLADAASSHLLKKNIQRIRPCNNDSIAVIARVPCGSGYSFTSSHAANHFALSFFLIFAVARRRRWLVGLLVFWAAVVAFSQVYVGVHYPLDVVGGALLGVGIAWLMYMGYSKWYTSDPKMTENV